MFPPSLDRPHLDTFSSIFGIGICLATQKLIPTIISQVDQATFHIDKKRHGLDIRVKM
jgi:hypothetical protein